MRGVPGNLANPVWVDDPHFDLAYHVRRSALPRPGSLEQLRELVARIVSRPLDRNRPLWEVYFVEGLADGRVAVLTKAHQALVDGAQIVDLAQVLLDRTPERRQLGSDDWHPGRPVTSTSLLAEAVRDTLGSPLTAVDTARSPDSVGRGADTADPAGRARSSTRWPAAAPTRTPRSAAPCPSSAASRPYAAASPTTAPFATPTAPPSTTSSSPPSPAGCGPG